MITNETTRYPFNVVYDAFSYVSKVKGVDNPYSTLTINGKPLEFAEVMSLVRTSFAFVKGRTKNIICKHYEYMVSWAGVAKEFKISSASVTRIRRDYYNKLVAYISLHTTKGDIGTLNVKVKLSALATLGLSSNFYKTLCKNGFKTFGDLINNLDKAFSLFKDGGQAHKQLSSILGILGVKTNTKALEPVISLENGAAKCLVDLNNYLELNSVKLKSSYRQDLINRQQEIRAKRVSDFCALSVDDLGLSIRAINCLRRGDCHRVYDILKLGVGLPDLRNLGSSSLYDIYVSLRAVQLIYVD